MANEWQTNSEIAGKQKYLEIMNVISGHSASHSLVTTANKYH